MTKPSYQAIIGRRGGLVGGPARAAALTPERRQEIARQGAIARHEKAGHKMRESKPKESI